MKAVATREAIGVRAVGGRVGANRVSVQLVRGPQVDMMTMPPGIAGTYLVHFTGSAEHNVRLRAIARDQGWSLSEHGFARLNDDGEVATGASAEVRRFATEQEVYDFLGLEFIPPELREDRGEIEAARAGRLPAIVAATDLRGDCHTHSEWSDGHEKIERMAELARERGLAYQVLTDHSQSLSIANGLTPHRVEQQRRIIGDLNESYARDGLDFRLLHGCELEIRPDGKLDYEDELLKRFDVVVASLHVGRKQPRAQLMSRYRVALDSPHVDIIAHPSGRKIGIRDDLDLDWDAFYREAAETRTVLELNGSDERLDLDDRRARAALDAGNRFTIDSDAHYQLRVRQPGLGCLAGPPRVARTAKRPEHPAADGVSGGGPKGWPLAPASSIAFPNGSITKKRGRLASAGSAVIV